MHGWHVEVRDTEPTRKGVRGRRLVLCALLESLPLRSPHPPGPVLLIVTPATLIEQELAAAQAAQQDGNNGKARVCARRAVALATAVWLARLSMPLLRGDAMAQLRQIQQNASFPLPIRQAAERLSTPVTRQHTAPFTADPIADAKLIITHLGGTTSDHRSR